LKGEENKGKTHDFVGSSSVPSQGGKGKNEQREGKNQRRGRDVKGPGRKKRPRKPRLQELCKRLEFLGEDRKTDGRVRNSGGREEN